MINICDKTSCCGCTACMNKCPKNAISMQEDEYGFKYPVVDKDKCINCGICENVCPIINNKTLQNNPKAYACINKNEEVRMESSSGGMFSLIANYILERNGVVFGAAFDEEFNLRHIAVDNIDDISKLRASKYLQSYIGNTYKEAKKYLDDGTMVLFTGTPCQIEGLKFYLQREYENLYTQDIICHGVPSPKVWKKYREYREKIDKIKPQEINFRNKDNGWHLYNLKFSYENKKYYAQNKNNDLYMKSFLSDLCLRDSCYDCSFKKKNRISDITLGDFWGIDKIDNEMDDNKGTSLVIVNSEKGKRIFDDIKDECIRKEVDLDLAINYNKSFIKSSNQNHNRDKFFKELDSTSFDKLIKKHVQKKNIIKRILGKVKRVLKGR